MSRSQLVGQWLRDPAALLVAKVTVILALASLASVAAHGFSAARRHLLWFAALASCLWLAISSPLVPRIAIRASALAAPRALHQRSDSPTVIEPSHARIATTAPHSSETLARTTDTPHLHTSSSPSNPIGDHPLIALWVLGCILLFARHAAGLLGTMGLARRAQVADDRATSHDLTSASAAVALRRRVIVAYSSGVTTPITFGISPAYVLLPVDAESWSSERRRAVLVHELGHVARGDWIAQTIARIACELFWFHPLAWRALAQLRHEAERAADDCVLHSGMPAPRYATQLFELARNAPAHAISVNAVGIVSGNDLERRFVAMFDGRRSRAVVTPRARIAVTSAMLAMVCPLASLHLADPPRPVVELRKAAPSNVHPSLGNGTTLAAADRGPTRSTDTASTPQALGSTANLPGPGSIASLSESPPQPATRTHPDLSGVWTQDTIAGPVVLYEVTDSTIITQSDDAISFESRGHVLDVPIRSRYPSIPFGGAGKRGEIAGGGEAYNVIATAQWLGDTLIFDTHIEAPSGGYHHTIERMTLSADGNTLINENIGSANSRLPWSGPHTFILRRIKR